MLLVVEYHVEVNSRRGIICEHLNYSDLITCFTTLNVLGGTKHQLSAKLWRILVFSKTKPLWHALCRDQCCTTTPNLFYLHIFLIPCGRNILVSLVLEPEDSHQSGISLSECLFQVSNMIFSVSVELSHESSISSVDCNLLICIFSFKYLKVQNGQFLPFLSLTAAEAWT